MLSELLYNDTYCIPIEVVTDSKSLYDTLHSKKNVLEKFLRIDIALLKEFIDNKSITKIHYVPSQNQLANVLTKKGACVNLICVNSKKKKKKKKNNNNQVQHLWIVVS